MCGDGHAHGLDGSPSTECDTDIITQYSPQLISQLSDAHCHIQDDRQNIYALVDSWKNGASNTTVAPLYAGNICLMGVQPSKDLGLETTTKDTQEAIESLTLNTSTVSSSSVTPTNIITVSWNDTDTKGDWDLVSQLAHDYPDRFVPSFGIHPWFTHKYQPLQEKDSNAVEIGGARRHGKNVATTEGASAEAEPILSFSSAAVTAVPGSGVRHEAFLAMSKQLQEQMAKESLDRELGQSQNAATKTESSHQSQEAPKDQETVDEGNDNNDRDVPIRLSSHLQHQQDHPSSVSPRLAHYQQVLQVPASAPITYLPALAARLPEPRALEPAMQELRRKLEEHPTAVLGEIGLDRTARVPEPCTPAETPQGDASATGGQKKTTLALTSIQHQLNVVREQLKIAASLDRAVSFHCVQAYGHWHDFLIQEGRRLKQREADQEYRQQLQQIHASGGTPTLDSTSLLGGQEAGARLSKRGAARLRREAREAEWERHVASTVQESSDEEDEDSEDEEEICGSSSEERKKKSGSNPGLADSTPAPLVLPPVPVFEEVLPPRLCMHSYGGSVDMMRAFTKMDHPPEIFFSFSILINGRLQERKLQELIQAVPEDRLLIESDHHSYMLLDGLLMDMVKKVSEIRGWTIEQTVQKTTRNWHRFVYGH
ncbi:hypothetical protein BG006_004946 [Podila minutissima]|uniref:Metallo-dependent hydrolase n=1 Tax=Podila minutissima TaxID=64525 RepID=A0A9P5SKF6_9FUNG|nr:hypothetical protein BG006_004946 [Podila minutissima]